MPAHQYIQKIRTKDLVVSIEYNGNAAIRKATKRRLDLRGTWRLENLTSHVSGAKVEPLEISVEQYSRSRPAGKLAPMVPAAWLKRNCQE